MRKYLILLSLIVLLAIGGSSYALHIIGGGRAGQTVAEGAECTAGTGDQWTNTNNEDYWGVTGDLNGNYVANAQSITVCKIAITLNYNSGGATAHLELWSDSAREGTQYGGTPDTQSINEAAPGIPYTFEFDTTNQPITGNFYVHVIGDTEGVCMRCSDGSGCGFFGTDAAGYNLYTNGANKMQDCVMTIWYLQ